jgi:serine/threonine protein kinase
MAMVEHVVGRGANCRSTCGALVLPMAGHISRQLVSAVAYFHGRAVIHRDIKPDNMIVVGAIKE